MMRYVALALVAGATPLVAAPIELQLPMDCTLGETCFIQQYVDQDPGPAATDFTCGSLSYQGHKGTDFALPDFDAQRAGVTVLAAAPGRVRGMRDGMPDLGSDNTPPDQLAGRDCGNGVVIDHGDGWETQYCHLAQGSISVRSGDQVAAGDPLGRVGFSGRTQFPHMHLSVRHNGAVVDPFSPGTAVDCAAPEPSNLWALPLEYAPSALLSLGLADSVPDYDAIKQGLPDPDLRSDAPLVLWGYAYGAEAGDTMRMEITGPNGPIHDSVVEMEHTQAQYFRAAGRRAPKGGWPTGRYTGAITVVRDGQTLDYQRTTQQVR